MLVSLEVTRYFRNKDHREQQIEELYSIPYLERDSSFRILERVCKEFNQYRLENGPDSFEVYDTIQIQTEVPDSKTQTSVDFVFSECLFDNSSDISGAVIRYIRELQ